MDIVDRYVDRDIDSAYARYVQVTGPLIRKLGTRFVLPEGPAEVACTNFYLDDDERGVLGALPVRLVRKRSASSLSGTH